MLKSGTPTRKITGILGIMLLLASIAHLLLPSPKLGLEDLYDAVFTPDSLGQLLIFSFRLPRLLLAILVAVAFAVAGSIMQRLMRNPLASPDILGVNAGASLGALIGLIYFDLTGLKISVAAFIGAISVVTIMVFLSGLLNQKSIRFLAGPSLVLIGIGIGAALHAAIMMLLTLAPNTKISEATLWLSGSLNPASWERLQYLTPALLLLGVFVWVLTPGLRALDLGPELANSLGVKVKATTILLMFTVALLVAVATAAAGPVSFIAFIAGPVATQINAGRPHLGISALVGANILVLADLGGQTMPSGPYPVGVITGAVGAAFLLYILLRKKGVTG